MPSNVTVAAAVFLCLSGMFCHVYHQKKQFYPTMVYLSKSGAAIAGVYVEVIFLALIASTILRKIFFGELRPIESERLAERSWYALTETCLAFTIFKDETVPVFVVLFALLIFLKMFHWLTNERVGVIERSTVLSKSYHVRIIAVFLILGAIDVSFIVFACKQIMRRGPTIHVVFGFENCILLIMLLDDVIKYVMYIHGLFEYSTSEARDMAHMYVSVAICSLKVILYSTFFFWMVQNFTLPLYILRPMYFTLKAFKKSVVNMLMTLKALRYLNEFYPNVTPMDLTSHDNSCIICREDLDLASKKLPCGHMFHTACLRTWFQRQQTCPTCRYSILQVPRGGQMDRMSPRTATISTQTDTQTHPCCGHTANLMEHIPNNLDGLSVEELKTSEQSQEEVLKSKIQKLNELILMMDTAAKSMEQLHTNSQENGDDKNVQKRGLNP